MGNEPPSKSVFVKTSEAAVVETERLPLAGLFRGLRPRGEPSSGTQHCHSVSPRTRSQRKRGRAASVPHRQTAGPPLRQQAPSELQRPTSRGLSSPAAPRTHTNSVRDKSKPSGAETDVCPTGPRAHPASGVARQKRNHQKYSGGSNLSRPVLLKGNTYAIVRHAVGTHAPTLHTSLHTGLWL